RGAPSAPSRFVSVIAGNDGKIIGIRVIEADFDSRTLSFYARLGYVVREALACVQGSAPGIVPRGPLVRAMREHDIETCNRLCRRIYGYDRDRELRDGVAQKTAVL